MAVPVPDAMTRSPPADASGVDVRVTFSTTSTMTVSSSEPNLSPTFSLNVRVQGSSGATKTGAGSLLLDSHTCGPSIFCHSHDSWSLPVLLPRPLSVTNWPLSTSRSGPAFANGGVL
jgi:hypothetical protein